MGASVERFFAGRVCGAAIVLLLLAELCFMPFTGHLFDTGVFLTLADYVFFAHTPLAGNWSFGSLSLLAVLLSQVPVLIHPALATAYRTRLFLLKMPSWFADLGTAAIVARCAGDPAYRYYWALRYLADPAVVFTTVFHGQWDALPNLGAVAGIALTAFGRYDLAAVALGLGAGTKFYPAAFVPLLFASAFRGASPRAALRSIAVFAVTAVVTLAPVFWGRFDYVVHSYTFNSFGPGLGVFTTSVWSLLPPQAWLSTRIEQLTAVAVTLALAAAALKTAPTPVTVARKAMFSAMAIVFLNPGGHPPFYLWVAGPIVLYAAIANDGLVSLLGVVLSLAGVLTQFCLEGSDEYFLVSIGIAPRTHALACAGSTTSLQGVVLVASIVLAFVAYRPRNGAWSTWWRAAAQAAVIACTCVFFAHVSTDAISAARRPHPANAANRLSRLFDTLAIVPAVKLARDGSCRLYFNSYGAASFANDPFAERFVKASLGYSLFSPETIDVRGSVVSVQSLPARREGVEIMAYDEGPVRVTREFDVTPLLKPIVPGETMIERPCALVAKNPLLIYRFDLEAARAAAAREPLLQRLDVFSQETPGQASIKAGYHA
ncbi:MAG TPA: glycosyltransferase family 87 protein [Candidatus Baltobacteraceae bacterium]